MPVTIWNWITFTGLVLDTIGAVGLVIVETNTVSKKLLRIPTVNMIKGSYSEPFRRGLEKLRQGEKIREFDSEFDALYETFDYGPDVYLEGTGDQEIEVVPVSELDPVSLHVESHKGDQVIVATEVTGQENWLGTISGLERVNKEVVDHKLKRAEDWKSLFMAGFLGVGFLLQSVAYLATTLEWSPWALAVVCIVLLGLWRVRGVFV